MAFFDFNTDLQSIMDPGKFTTAPKPTPTQFQNNQQWMDLFNQSMQRATQGQAQQGQGSQLQFGDDRFRQGQLQQIGQLQGIASGQQQGAGELAAQRQMGQALAAQQAQARMARGGNAALAYRNAANQSAALGSTGAGLGQQAALQDQMAAQGMLTGALGSGRGADITTAGQNAQLAQQASFANAQMRQQQDTQNQLNYLALLQQLNQRDQAKYNADLGIGAQRESADAAKSGGLVAGLGSAIAAFSDERLKTEVTDARADIDDMLDKLSPKSWRYKSERHGEGRWSGIMAQDAERSEVGKRIVRETPEGKALDLGKTMSTALAAVARLNERLRAVETR